MASIKQEPLSEEQWHYFIENFENQPDIYLSGYNNSASDQDQSSGNDATNQSFRPGSYEATTIKSEPVGPNMDWAFINPADQPFEIPADNTPNSNAVGDPLSSKIDELKALLELNSRYIEQKEPAECLNSNSENRQIVGIHQYLAALHPFFQGMRTTLKALTQHVNPQWEVRTPTTPIVMQHGPGTDHN